MENHPVIIQKILTGHSEKILALTGTLRQLVQETTPVQGPTSMIPRVNCKGPEKNCAPSKSVLQNVSNRSIFKTW